MIQQFECEHSLDSRRNTARTLLLGLAFCACLTAHAADVAVTLDNAVKGSSQAPVAMRFDVDLSAPLAYDLALDYHSSDGTAFAGLDYTAASGTAIVPAGTTSVSIPLMLAPNTGAGPSVDLQLLLQGARTVHQPPVFGQSQVFPLGVQCPSVVSTDINGDGRKDLVLANENSRQALVMINTASDGDAVASFAPVQAFAIPAGAFSAQTADINGDGLQDVIITSYLGNSVVVLLNTTTVGSANASFEAPQAFPVGQLAFAVAVDDFNADGKPDLAVTNYTDGTMSVLLNTTPTGAGTATFVAQQVFATGLNPYSVASADINGDGRPDLIVADENSGTASVFLNTTPPLATTASFALRQPFSVGYVPVSVFAADLNGDGKPDLAVGNNGDGTVSVLINKTLPGSSTADFHSQQVFAYVGYVGASTLADVDGDGRPDLVLTNQDVNGAVSVLLNATPTGSATASFFAQHDYPVGGGFPSAVVVSDLNGDGKPDLTTANISSGDASVLINASDVACHCTIVGSPATGTIVHDYIFADSLE